MVWISEPVERRKPSLSASRIATSDDLGHVEPLAQQVDADQHVELAEAQVADDLDALDGLDVGVQVAHADLCSSRYSVRSSAMRLVSVVISTRSRAAAQRMISASTSSTWVRAGRTSTSRIEQAGRPHDLLDELPWCACS